MVQSHEALETLEKGINIISDLTGNELSLAVLDWKIIPLGVFAQYFNYRIKKMRARRDFWLNCISPDFPKNYQIGYGTSKAGLPSDFDRRGAQYAVANPFLDFVLSLSEVTGKIEEPLRDAFHIQDVKTFTEITLGELAMKIANFKIINDRLPVKNKPRISIGGWVVSDDAKALLTQLEPEFQFRIKGREDKPLTNEELEEIRKTGVSKDWIIYDTANEKPVVIPKQFAPLKKFNENDRQVPYQKDGAIVIFAKHPDTNKDILALMGAKAPSSCISPIILSDPDKWVDDNAKKMLMDARDTGTAFEAVVEVNFKRYDKNGNRCRWGAPPSPDFLDEKKGIKFCEVRPL